MVMNTFTPNRVAAGKSTGGQFAEKINSEADFDLPSDSYDEEFDYDYEDGVEDVEDDAEDAGVDHKINLRDFISDDEAVQIVDSFRKASMREAGRATYSTRSGDGTGDDEAQEAIIRFMVAKAKGSKIASADRYMNTLIRQEHSNSTFGVLGSQNRAARKILDRRVSEMEEILRKKVTPSERKEMADQLREWWPDQRHRPTKDFQDLQFEQENIESMPEGRKAEFEAATAVLDGSYAKPDHEGYWTSVALNTREGIGPDGKKLAGPAQGHAKSSAKFAWNALAETRGGGLPFVTKDHMSKRQGGNVRRAVNEAGGCLDVANRWENGEDNEATEALFAPFGNVTDVQKAKIVDTFTEYPEFAPSLWASAVTFAARD